MRCCARFYDWIEGPGPWFNLVPLILAARSAADPVLPPVGAVQARGPAAFPQ